MKRFAIAASALLLTGAVAVRADHHEKAKDAYGEAAAHAGDANKAAYMAVYDDAAQKLQSLAEAFPEETYAWRPAEGVRSVGEAFQHAAGSLYLLTSMMGVQPPEGAPGNFEEMMAMEKQSSKADVAASLAKALAYGRNAADTASAEQLDGEYDFFGNKMSGRTVYLIAAAHLHEHLGQLIAYARSNGVVPPWSAAQSGGGD